MKKILFALSALFFAFCWIMPVYSYQNSQSAALSVLFEKGSEIPQFKSLAIKSLTKSETLRYSKTNRHEFLGVKKLIDILGEIHGDNRKVILTAHYQYISDSKPMSVIDTATWYYFISKKNQKPIYGLYYPTNDITKQMDENDLLIIGKLADNEIYVFLIDKDSKRYKDFVTKFGYDFGVKEQKTSFWSRLWGNSATKTEEYEIETANLQMPEIPQGAWMRIYFTPGTACEDNIIAEIEKAKNIDVAVYSITNQKIVDSLIVAKNRGANVRIITDYLQSKGKKSLVQKLRDEGFPVETNRVNGKMLHRIMHTKIALFDNTNVVSGSYNWTNSATESNVEVCMFFPQPEGKEITQFYKNLWNKYKEKSP